jgi:DNA-binding transcriptional ArsR family regulator
MSREHPSEPTELCTEDIPITMPDLPMYLTITTMQQWKALNDPLRKRLLDLIQQQPATAKQLADRLGATPGAIGHHLHVLEDAGLAQVVARRLIRGIVAKYYARTARIFDFDLPPEITGHTSVDLTILSRAHDELVEALTNTTDDPYRKASLRRARLSPERIHAYQERIQTLITDFLQEQADPDGQVYDLSIALFRAPTYLQNLSVPEPEYIDYKKNGGANYDHEKQKNDV